ncbi:MAG: tetratricopeptide repeat protein [Paludibacter sp.]
MIYEFKDEFGLCGYKCMQCNAIVNKLVTYCENCGCNLTSAPGIPGLATIEDIAQYKSEYLQTEDEHSKFEVSNTDYSCDFSLASEFQQIEDYEDIENYNNIKYEIVNILEILLVKYGECLLIEANPIELKFGGVLFSSDINNETIRFIFPKTQEYIDFFSYPQNSKFFQVNFEEFLLESFVLYNNLVNMYRHNSFLEILKNADEYNDLGVVYKDEKNYEKAIKSFHKALEINPNHALSYKNLGFLNFDIENYDEAIICFQKAIDNNYHDTDDLYIYIGLSYLNKMDFENAIKILQKGLDETQSWSGFCDFNINLGDAYVKQKNFNEAVKYYQQVIDEMPNTIEAHIKKGDVYMIQSEYNKAIECWLSAINIDFFDSEVYNKIGEAYSQLQDIENANIYLKKALQIRN